MGPLESDPQAGYWLLRMTGGFTKLVPYMRLHDCSDHLARADAAVVACFEHLVGPVNDPDAITQLSLRVRQGGMGLRRASDHHQAAFLASSSTAKSSFANFFPPQNTTSSSAPSNNAPLLPSPARNASSQGSCVKKQKELSAIIDARILQSLQPLWISKVRPA